MKRGAVFVALALLGAPLLAGSAASAQSWRTENVSRRASGEQILDVRVQYAVGRFELAPVTGGTLYSIQSRFDEEAFDLYSHYRRSDGRGRLRIDLEGLDDVEVHNLNEYDELAGNLTLGLTKATPVSLDLKLGAVEALLDLGGLRLNDVRLTTGASETRIRFSEKNSEVAESCAFKAGAAEFEVEGLGNSGCREITFDGGVGTVTLDFSGEWGHDASGEIRVGLGTIEIRVPAELGVRIERQTFFMSFEAPDFWKGDDAYVSRNWSEAEDRLELRVKGALGSIKVVRI